jgi:hypothetical protein
LPAQPPNNRIYICPSCPGRRKVVGYTNWRVHIQKYHENIDPRFNNGVGQAMKKVDESLKETMDSFECTWKGCERTFESCDTFYSHVKVTHGGPELPSFLSEGGPVQDELESSFQNWLYLADSYRDYCRDHGYPDPLSDDE